MEKGSENSSVKGSEKKEIKSIDELNPNQLAALEKIFLNPARNEGETFENYKNRRKLRNEYYKRKKRGKVISFEEHINSKK